MVETLIDKRAQNYVRSVVRHHVQKQDVEDVVQEAFTVAIEKIDRYQPGNFRAWVAAIARNIARNIRRKNRKNRKHVCLDMLDDSKPFIEEREIPRELDYAIDILSEHERNLIYAIANGCSYAECADKFELPIGTVMSRLMRARMKVRVILGR